MRKKYINKRRENIIKAYLHHILDFESGLRMFPKAKYNKYLKERIMMCAKSLNNEITK